MDRVLPDREELLTEIFNTLKAHQPIREKALFKEMQANDEALTLHDFQIGLCMLQGSGLVELFAQEIERPKFRKKLSPPLMAIFYKTVEPIAPEPEIPATPPPPVEPRKRSIWERLFHIG